MKDWATTFWARVLTQEHHFCQPSWDALDQEISHQCQFCYFWAWWFSCSNLNVQWKREEGMCLFSVKELRFDTIMIDMPNWIKMLKWKIPWPLIHNRFQGLLTICWNHLCFQPPTYLDLGKNVFYGTESLWSEGIVSKIWCILLKFINLLKFNASFQV